MYKACRTYVPKYNYDDYLCLKSVVNIFNVYLINIIKKKNIMLAYNCTIV